MLERTLIVVMTLGSVVILVGFLAMLGGWI